MASNAADEIYKVESIPPPDDEPAGEAETKVGAFAKSAVEQLFAEAARSESGLPKLGYEKEDVEEPELEPVESVAIPMPVLPIATSIERERFRFSSAEAIMVAFAVFVVIALAILCISFA